MTNKDCATDILLKKIHKTLLTVVYLTADLSALTAAYFSSMWMVRGWPANTAEALDAVYNNHQVFVVVLAGVWILLFIKSLYVVIDRNRGWYEELNETGSAVAYFITVILISRLFLGNLLLPIEIYVLFCIFFPVYLTAVRHAASRLRHHIYSRGILQSRVLLIGSRYVNQLLIKRQNILSAGYYFNIIGMVDDDLSVSGRPGGIRHLGNIEDLPAIIEKERIEEIFITNPTLGRKKLFSILEHCETKNMPFYVVTNIFDIIFSKRDIFEVSGVSMIRVNENMAAKTFLFIKRSFDIVAAAALSLILSPILLLIACGIRLDSPGSIIFSQIRMGTDKKAFRMFKFRTMCPDAEEKLKDMLDINTLEQPVFKMKSDPRVTKFGRILRKFSLDELPQIWNILKGDMSFVGPRPEEKRIVDIYNVYERRRLKIKPGLTGLQQVSCRNSTDFDERMFYDLFYIQKRSIFMDMYILWKTLFCLHKGK